VPREESVMVSAVFHSPLDASQQLAEEKKRAAPATVRPEPVEGPSP
jgi:hypothetical protein